jgi:hypothetical protein
MGWRKAAYNYYRKGADCTHGYAHVSHLGQTASQTLFNTCFARASYDVSSSRQPDLRKLKRSRIAAKVLFTRLADASTMRSGQECLGAELSLIEEEAAAEIHFRQFEPTVELGI